MPPKMLAVIMGNFPAFILPCLAIFSFPFRLYYFIIIKKQSYFHFDKKRNINYTSAERQKKKKYIYAEHRGQEEICPVLMVVFWEGLG